MTYNLVKICDFISFHTSNVLSKSTTNKEVNTQPMSFIYYLVNKTNKFVSLRIDGV